MVVNEKVPLKISNSYEHENKITLIKSLKGIKHLVIQKQDLTNLKDKCVAIYGANGTGKSSFKHALVESTEELVPNWEVRALPEVLEDIKFGKYYACFDEHLVNLVRGFGNYKVKFLNFEISNLAELLNNRKNSIDHVNSFYPDFKSLFEVDIAEIKRAILHLDKAMDTWLTIKHIQSVAGEGLWENMVSLWSNLVKLVAHAYEIIALNIKNEELFCDHKDHRKQTFAEKDFGEIYWLIENKVKIKDINFESFSGKLFCFRQYLNLIYELITNFGYKEYDKEIEKIVENYRLMEAKFENTKSKAFVTLNLLSQDQIKEIKNQWNKNAKLVEENLSLANNLLEPYNVEYEVVLNRTTIENENQNLTNFGIKHKNSGQLIQSNLIEKCVSYGEFNLIALTLFISSVISRKPKNEDIYILFDDPVSSYDLSKIHVTLNIIKTKLLNDPQIRRVVFLSHEKYFIKKLTLISSVKDPLSIEAKTFQLVKSNISELRTIDLDKEGDLQLIKKIRRNENGKFHVFSQVVAHCQYLEIGKLFSEKKVNRDQVEVLHSIKHFQTEQLNQHSIKVLKDLGIVFSNQKKLIEEMKKIPNFDLKENMLGLRSWLNHIYIKNHPEEVNPNFFRRVRKELQINLDDSNIKSDLERCSQYEFTLDGISHFSSSQLGVDISRLDEILDLLFASRQKMFEIFDRVFEYLEIDFSFSQQSSKFVRSSHQ